MNDILSGTYKGNTYRIKVECYPNTPAIKVQLLPVNAGERITMTQNLGQPLPRYQAFLCDGMLEVDSTAFMDYMEENDLGYIVDYKRYDADVFTGVNRRTAAVFQFHSAALRRLNKVGCQRYEGDYTRLKQKHAERRARRMAGTSFRARGNLFLCISGVNALHGLTDTIRALGVREVVEAIGLDQMTNPNVRKAVLAMQKEVQKIPAFAIQSTHGKPPAREWTITS